MITREVVDAMAEMIDLLSDAGAAIANQHPERSVEGIGQFIGALEAVIVSYTQILMKTLT